MKIHLIRTLPEVAGLTALAALALAGAALAQPPHGPFGLLEFDANGDGKLTRAEFDAAQKARFEQIDANKDGAATRAEGEAYFQARMDQRRDESGKERFKLLDSNNDGQISATEFAARPTPGDGPHGFRHGRHGGHGGHGGSRDGERADLNSDGKVNFQEFSARGAEAFTAADTNKDGVVTIPELQALRPPRR